MHTKNSDEITLNDMFIGYSDGELEANDDKFLELFYVENNKYKQIMSSSSKFIISGRKGTGKTILAKYIEKKELESNKLCKINKIGDFNIRCLIDLELRELHSKELMHFWKWTIYIGITELILKNPPKINKPKIFFSYHKLKTFYNKIYKVSKSRQGFIKEKIEETNSSRLAGGLNNKTTSFESKSDAEKAYSIKTIYKRAPYYSLLTELETLIYNTLKHYEITFIYDDLDGIEDTIQDDSSYRNILISLINIIKEINICFQKEKDIKCRLMVVIRDDILETLHSYNSNLNKVTSDCEVKLYWASQPIPYSPEKHPLMDLVLTKIQKSVPQFSDLNKKQLYKRLFPDKVDDKNIATYLLNFSMGRPRDVINFLNIIKKNASEEKAFTPSLFRAYKVEYSNTFYAELRNELSIHYKKEFVDDCLNILGDLKKIYFTYEIINKHYEANKTRYPNIEDIKVCIDFLYKFSIIGNSWSDKSKKNRQKFKTSWAYRSDGNPIPNYEHTFIIHNALQKHYSL
ncbi:P-loop ATPase, Sll1717 family [Clostridium intestinale]|uniref:P-loop ATPase, Sll1717 family n=1 Tax=Clostridium intestinale TaxID=36845 RepID=UPI0028E1B27D|nr:hypothetical protein [Clostridium intestinale]